MFCWVLGWAPSAEANLGDGEWSNVLSGSDRLGEKGETETTYGIAFAERDTHLVSTSQLMVYCGCRFEGTFEKRKGNIVGI